jgi:hypothetical protein
MSLKSKNQTSQLFSIIKVGKYSLDASTKHFHLRGLCEELLQRKHVVEFSHISSKKPLASTLSAWHPKCQENFQL